MSAATSSARATESGEPTTPITALARPSTLVTPSGDSGRCPLRRWVTADPRTRAVWAPPARDGASFPRPQAGWSRMLSLGVGAVDQSGNRAPEEHSHITPLGVGASVGADCSRMPNIGRYWATATVPDSVLRQHRMKAADTQRNSYGSEGWGFESLRARTPGAHLRARSSPGALRVETDSGRPRDVGGVRLF